MSTPLVKPAVLPAHAVLGVVAPASSALQARLDAGAHALTAHGWEVRFLPHAQGRSAPYFSASVADRLADLHAAFADPAIDAVLCTRGGYGSNYLLPLLDLDLIRAHPKPLLGYSDMTALASRLLDEVGLVSFHAPMLAADFYLPDGVDWPSLEAVLSGKTCEYGTQHGLHMLQEGEADGVLAGGCLTLLTSLLGTPFAPALSRAHGPTLLFLEDVGVKPYQVDRMLRQLKLASKLEGVTGILFGEMQDCSSPGAPPELLQQAIRAALADFTGPVAFGLRSGHVSRANVTLPLGVRARLRVSAGATTLTLLEPATEPRPGVRS